MGAGAAEDRLGYRIQGLGPAVAEHHEQRPQLVMASQQRQGDCRAQWHQTGAVPVPRDEDHHRVGLR